MRVGLYARVSSERQQERGTIASQLEALRAAAQADGHQVVDEFVDDGYSGARLDRPALDRLRDAAEAGLLEGVLCLCADRLARAYAYQVLILEELERFAVAVRFLEGPGLDADPQATLLLQMQGVIAQYEHAKMSERYRRGKLYRARAGEIIFWKAPYGFRRLPAGAGRPARMEVFEPEAQIVRETFRAYVEDGCSMRQLALRLSERAPSPNGKPVWSVSMIGRLLRNEAYIGTVYCNRHVAFEGESARRGVRNRKTSRRERPREEWIPITVPAIVEPDLFERAQRVSRDNSKFNPRGAEPGTWLLRGLVECCSALLDPRQLTAGEGAVLTATQPSEDELIAAQLKHLTTALEAAERERTRLLDAYQAGLIDLDQLGRRTQALTARRDQLSQEKDTLSERSSELASQNRLRRGLAHFAERVAASLDQLDFDARQRLLRLVVEKVRVQGWRVEIHLKIPLPNNDADDNNGGQPPLPTTPPRPSSDVGLRPLDIDGEEVAGDCRRSLLAQERPPAQPVALRRRRDTRRPQDVAQERGGDIDPQLAQFTDDPHVAPARVLTRQPQDELAHLAADWRPARTTMRIRPVVSDQSPMPPKSVSGRTKNTFQLHRGSTRLNAASKSRSHGSNRGRSACRRRIDNSCRSTRISSSFERSRRPNKTINSNSRHTTTYTSDKPKNDLHKTGRRRYRDINTAASATPPAGADRICAPHGLEKQLEPQHSPWLDFEAARSYLGFSRDRLYKLTAAQAIPFRRKENGQGLLFHRDELDAWLKTCYPRQDRLA